MNRRIFVNRSDDDVVAIGGFRTPFSKYGGALKEWSSIDIGGYLLPRALHGLGLDPQRVDYLIEATAFQPEAASHTNILARQMIIKAGLPLSIPSITIDVASCSGLAAVQLARSTILAGDADVVVAMGTEACSNTGYLLPASLP